MLKLIRKIIPSKGERDIKKLYPIVEKINSLESTISALTDIELRGKTTEFLDKLDRGASLEDILPDAFAVCREAGKRTVNMRHFDVQLMGGLVLFQGKIAEMKTGEGKFTYG